MEKEEEGWKGGIRGGGKWGRVKSAGGGGRVGSERERTATNVDKEECKCLGIDRKRKSRKVNGRC